MTKATVTNIQGYSIHDGDGIRTVVFLKGCPLRCKWCANPENIDAQPQLGFLSKLCIECGKCAKTCTNGAIVSGSGVYRINHEACIKCFNCVENCYYDALVRYGSEMTVQEVYDKIERDRMFYEESGGGVTVSGGEPLIHIDFVEDLFSLCRAGNISTCVETCGHVQHKSIERIAPLTDQFYFDLKCLDSELHRQYTGVGNELILENARYLVSTGANILFRQPFIPGVNNGAVQIEKTTAFLRSLGGSHKLQLMPYHRMGKTKYEALALPYTMEDTPIMSSEELSAVQEMFQRLGIDCSISH